MNRNNNLSAITFPTPCLTKSIWCGNLEHLLTATVQTRASVRLILVFTILTYCLGASAQTFTNGSFEIPGGIPAGTSHHVDDLGSPLAGWIIGGTGGMANVVNGEIPSIGLDFPPIDGTYEIAFNGGDSPAGRTLSQSFSTKVGAGYEVTFYVGRFGTAIAISVRLDATIVSSTGQVLTNYTAAPPGHGYGPEQRITFDSADKPLRPISSGPPLAWRKPGGPNVTPNAPTTATALLPRPPDPGLRPRAAGY